MGCSWIFVRKPPPGPVEAAPRLECTSSVVSPVLDTVGAVYAAGLGLYLMIVGIQSESHCSPSSPCSPEGYAFRGSIILAGATAVAAAVPLGFSAAYGYEKTSDCRRLKEAQLPCASGVEDACRTLQERRPQ